jgi:thiamine biosynthesis lipoprotein
MDSPATALDLVEVLSHPSQSPQSLDLVVPTGMERREFAGMGTTISLLIPADRAAEAVQAVQTLFETWQATLTRFSPESELSRLNAHAGETVSVGPLLFKAVHASILAARATDGLYDPTLQHQMEQLGYDRTFAQVAGGVPEATTAPVAGGGWREIQVDAQQRTLRLPPGIGLDLGGLAKGMAVDAALAHLREQGIEAALINAGGDLAVLGLPPGSDTWPIAVPGKVGFWVVPLHHGAIATSGVARRHWRQGQVERHHLWDPRTGLPAQSGLWSVSVAAGTCAQAEVAAKATFVLGWTAGEAFLTSHNLAGLLVQIDGSSKTVGSWPVTMEEAIT